MSKILKVEINSGVGDLYNIVIEPDFIKLVDILLDVFPDCSKYMLVFDSNTDRFLKNETLKLIQATGKIVNSFTFTAGEDSKNLSTVKELYEELI